MKRLLLCALCLSAVLVDGACKGTRDVGLSITVPKDLVDTTVWFEIGAFKDASCGAITPMLGAGIPEGATSRVAFRRDEPSTPKFGDIPNGKYAFAAVARDESCAILAMGCHEDDVGDVDTVTINMTAAEGQSGKCTEGATCQAAKCVPANDNSDPSVGAGCSLELVGAGPLATPVGGQGTLVSAPAIAPTTTGFVIVYREIDPNGGSAAKLTILPIDLGGGALKPERPGLPNRCANSDESDGVGLLVSGEDAMVSLAKAACADKPALELLNFKTTTPDDPGRPIIGKFLVSSSPSGVKVTLGAARAAALRPGGGLVVFTEGGSGQIATMDPEKGIVGPNGSFGATTGITDTWIASSDKVLALLAVGGAAPSTPSGDGGADASLPPDPEAGDTSLRLLMVPATTPVNTINAETATPRPPIVFPGAWGSVAAREGRVLVLSDGTGPGRSVTYRAFNLNNDAIIDQSGFSVEGAGKVTAGDVAIVGDRAYFAVVKQGTVALHVYNNATTTLTPLRSVSFQKEPRISGINTVRDGRIAVAATDTRVAVVWTTAKVLNNNDATGGYAVFGCTK